MEAAIRPLSADDMEESARTLRERFGAVAAEFGLTPENRPTNGAFTRKEHLEQACGV